jgi:murein DD-endopeptidase MepM/ murein hydrolase activator NlpD
VGLQTATPGSPSIPATQSRPEGSEPDYFIYHARPGDTLSALAYRFGVSPEEIKSPESIPDKTFLTPGQTLSIPNRLGKSLYPNALLPDSEIIYSPSTVDFQIEEYINNSGGYLSTYGEMVDGDWSSAAEIVQRVAADHSINPRLLLAFLEYRSQWVLGQPANPNDIDHPLGFKVPGYRGLYYELGFTATQLNIGYYGWRLGTLTELQFHDGSRVRLSPQLNPGSVALQRLFSKLYDQLPWFEALYGQNNFLSLYHQMFGDPWARAAKVEPLFTNDLAQPALELPFQPGERWSFTGGPHMSWNTGTTRGGLDFAPVTGEPACVVSRAWATASASGVIVRSDNNVVVIDLDGDGYESTGWVLMYLHVAEADRVPLGTEVNLDDRLGHPSCERGKSTGTHLHIARKYNGEWIEADGPLPFVLSGWEIEMGPKIYQGSLVKGGQEVAANPLGPGTSIIVR